MTLRLSFACELAAVRPTAQAVRTFLEAQGLHPEETAACDLALTEACNNAVEYVRPEQRQEPVEVQVFCTGSLVEFQIKDRTPGFDWPAPVTLPPATCERGRGLFIIQSLMNEVSYTRGPLVNTLVMSKRRVYQGHRMTPPAPVTEKEARLRLAECQHTIRNMVRELCFRSESLSAIFRCTAELGRTDNLEGFSQRLLNDLILITGADWFILRLVLPGGPQLVAVASSERGARSEPPSLPTLQQNPASIEIRSAQAGEDLQFGPSPGLSPDDPIQQFKPDSAGLVHPIFFGETLIGTLAIGRSRAESPFTLEQIEVIHTFAEFLAIQVVNTRLQDERLQMRLVSRELEIARDIQRALLPKSLPRLPGFGLAAYYESARQVGGDFYNVLSVSENSFWLVVADVMGKGVPAAMFAAILRNLVPAVLPWVRQPSDLLGELNRLLYEELSRVDMFITAQLVLVDLDRRQLTAAGAGHCPILLANSEQEQVEVLVTEGMPLGVVPNASFQDVTVRLGSGCRVLLYTDGLTEAGNDSGELFGQSRLMSWLQNTTGRLATALNLKDELVAELDRFQLAAKMQDDQTFLLLAEEAEIFNPRRVPERLASVPA